MNIFKQLALILPFVLGAQKADKLPGFLGEVQTDLNKPISIGVSNVEWSGQIEQLSWSPRAYLLKGFLTDEECEHIINMSKSTMTSSAVVDTKTGRSVPSEVRTSTGTFFSKGQDDIISRIEQRVAEVSMIPVDNQEGMQVLHYVDGQKYEPHHDYFHDPVNSDPKKGGQRVVTILMYLSTPEEGGETVMPESEHKVSGDGWSECAQKGMAVKAVKGNALMFFSLKPDGTPDPSSLHGSCPTLKGEKWSATKWIHVGSFGRSAQWQKERWAGCDDKYDTFQCAEWAATGECEANKAFMLKNCIKSCNRCTANGGSGSES